MPPKSAAKSEELDLDLEDLPQQLRWREWMARVEAVIFASAQPVSRDQLLKVVGRNCALELLIDDIRNELQDRPYDIAVVAGGWQIRTRARYGAAIKAAHGRPDGPKPLSRGEALVLTSIAYMQPVTRTQISRMIGREVGRETIARLSREGFIAKGPRSPEPGAPYTFVTTQEFLIQFGLQSLRDLPDLEALQDAGLLQADTRVDLPIMPEDQDG